MGRGLRKAEAKEYVVILDFIGNYNNNFMIPIALSGDRTYNKDNIRRYVMEGERMIPGASTVHFDEVSRKRIFASVDNANFSDIRLIKENYTNLKNKLGRIPRLRDFDEYGEMDVIRIFDNNSLGSYYKFLVKYEKEYKTRLPEDEEKVIEFVSKKLANGKRIQELQMLKRILTYARGLAKFGLFAGLSEDMRKYGKDVSQDQKENIVNVMTNEFPAGASKKTYAQCVFIEKNENDYCGERMKLADREEAMPYMLQSIFLLTPVISTTFASAQTFLGDVKKSGVLGTLIIDEAGQAQPQMAVGAMFRCRKAIIVGDPKQIEPVVTAETDMIKQLLTAEILAGYKDKKISVQAFADYINPYGTYLGKDEEKEWVGCPLVVHRRCIDPMYTISNVLSYDGTMKQQTAAPKEDRARTFILDKSCWIDVAGAENSGKKDHFVKAQGELVLKLLARKFERDPIDIPRLFIITPFTSVKEGMLEMIKKSELYGKEPRVRKWLNANNIGTVHTFQGQGTDEVIFLLGCDSKSMGAVNWVNNNIVNVAATRAKFRFYMIGDKSVWTCRPVRVARECTAEILTAKEVEDVFGGKPQEIEAISDGTQKKGTKTSDHLKKNGNKMPQDSSGDIKSAPAKMSMICPECGKKLVERSGKFGKFIGCSGFPKCRFTQSV